MKTDYLRRRGIGISRKLAFDRFANEYGLEELRQAVRRELRTHCGQEALARMIGVGRAVIRKLVDMRSVPQDEHLDRIREWMADRPAVETDVGAVALALLVADLPAAERYRARFELAGELADAYRRVGVEVPQWLANDRADRRGAR